MDQKTGNILRANDMALMVEKQFTASQERMDVEMEFVFDSAAYAGRTIVVFEYLYQNEVEISRHADLDDLMQQIYVNNNEIRTTDKKEEDLPITPRTGDVFHPFSVICSVVGAVGVIAISVFGIYRKYRKKI